MSRTAIVVLLSLGLWIALSPEARPEKPAWASEIEAALRDPGRASRALQLLEARPAADRMTLVYQLLLAKALSANGQAGPAADAAACASLLLAQGKKGPLRWLDERGQECYQRSLAARTAGDTQAAVKAYFQAIRWSRPIARMNDHGLKAQSLATLERLVQAKPGAAEPRYQLAVAHYLFGQLPAAFNDLKLLLNLETAPYRRWRAGLLMARVRTERASETHLPPADPPATAAPSPAAVASAGFPSPTPHPVESATHRPPVPAESNADGTRIAELRSRISAIDSQIDYLSKNPGSHKSYELNGRNIWTSGADSRVQEAIEQLQEKRGKLVSELGGLGETPDAPVTRASEPAPASKPISTEDRHAEVAQKLRAVESELADLESDRKGWRSVEQGGKRIWVGQNDSRVQERIAELRSQKEQLSKERDFLSPSGSSSSEGSGAGASSGSAGTHDQGSSEQHQKIVQELQQVESDLKALTEEGNHWRYVTDSDGNRRRVSPNDSRVPGMIDELKERQRKLSEERDSLR